MTEQEYDVVVVGSGAAGMVAAPTGAHQGLSTVVVEKVAHYGGSTARSGGGVWIPNYSDYYPETAGGKSSGRSVEPSGSTPTSWAPTCPVGSRRTARFR